MFLFNFNNTGVCMMNDCEGCTCNLCAPCNCVECSPDEAQLLRLTIKDVLVARKGYLNALESERRVFERLSVFDWKCLCTSSMECLAELLEVPELEKWHVWVYRRDTVKFFFQKPSDFIRAMVDGDIDLDAGYEFKVGDAW